MYVYLRMHVCVSWIRNVRFVHVYLHTPLRPINEYV